ncbi:MAG: CNNM domain-containing protein [Desulfuromonadales bacterium]|nr:CNNM domain-containing protein [Desulfuromonadales bacterium]MDW7756379.1 CNNM domain-containing protein [Desulfuromonadales bacterium]
MPEPDDVWIRLSLLAVLFVLSAFFSGSETALMSLDKLRLKYLVQKKRRGAERLEELLDSPEKLLGGILVGNNLVNIAISVFATGLLVQLYGEKGELLTILLVTPLLLVFSEVLPKSYAAKQSEAMSFAVLRPIGIVLKVLAPAIWLITGVTRFLSRLIPGEQEKPILSEDEIRTIITVGEQTGVVHMEKHQMLHGIFDLAEMRVRDVMIPRTEVVGIEVHSTFEEALLLVQQAHHSRFPVYEENLDSIVGIIHSKDILSFVGSPDRFSLRDIARPPYFVPESKRIETLLQSFRRKRMHLAIVVDEYGGVEGIVTLEDIFEEIVGEIQDEYDVEEEMLRELAPGRYLVDGSTSLRTINKRFHLKLSEEHVTTLAGFLLRALGTIPQEGETCESEGVQFIVRKVVDRRIEEIEMLLPESTKDS